MVSLWTSISSPGFPGGSLGPWNKLARRCFMCSPFRPYILDLVILDNATSLPLVELLDL